jgi:hypothetical protein
VAIYRAVAQNADMQITNVARTGPPTQLLPSRLALAAMSHTEALSRPASGEQKMKSTFAIILAALTAAALFGVLVYAVLVAAHVAEPVVTTVYGVTARPAVSALTRGDSEP